MPGRISLNVVDVTASRQVKYFIILPEQYQHLISLCLDPIHVLRTGSASLFALSLNAT